MASTFGNGAAAQPTRTGGANTALVLAIVAFAGSIVASAIVGMTIGPQQAASGG